MTREESALLLTKANPMRNIGSLSNQALGACFKPYKARLRWHTWS